MCTVHTSATTCGLSKWQRPSPSEQADPAALLSSSCRRGASLGQEVAAGIACTNTPLFLGRRPCTVCSQQDIYVPELAQQGAGIQNFGLVWLQSIECPLLLCETSVCNAVVVLQLLFWIWRPDVQRLSCILVSVGTAGKHFLSETGWKQEVIRIKPAGTCRVTRLVDCWQWLLKHKEQPLGIHRIGMSSSGRRPAR
jgi:hypothetical protein